MTGRGRLGPQRVVCISFLFAKCPTTTMDAASRSPLLRAARSAVRLAARLTSAVQRSHTEFVSKADSSPVTTADFGAQAVVSTVLQAALPGPYRCVGEESGSVLRTKQHLLPQVVAAIETCLPGSSTVRGRSWSADGVCLAIDAGAYDGDPSESYWVLDPVDGTKGFLRGPSGQYAVGLAFVEGGKPVIAAIACPNLPYPSWGASGADAAVGTLFTASAGGGAFMEPLFGASADGGADSGPEAPQQRVRVSDTADATAAVICESFDAGHSDHAA